MPICEQVQVVDTAGVCPCVQGAPSLKRPRLITHHTAGTDGLLLVCTLLLDYLKLFSDSD